MKSFMEDVIKCEMISGAFTHSPNNGSSFLSFFQEIIILIDKGKDMIYVMK